MNSEQSNEPAKQLSLWEEFVEQSQNVPRDDSAGASIEKSALDESHALMEEIVDEGTIEAAWAKVKANRGAPGPDGVTIEDFPEWFRPQWESLRRQLIEGTYRPLPVRRVSIDKNGGGTRELGIPTQPAKSTLVQSAFGYRPNYPSFPSFVWEPISHSQNSNRFRRGVRDPKGIGFGNFLGSSTVDFDSLHRSLRRCGSHSDNPPLGAVD